MGTKMNFEADCVIFAGARIINKDSALKYLNRGAFYICADSGLLNAKELGVSPDMLVGDFDSARIPPEFTGEVMEYPPMKNETDLHLAASIAIDRGFNNVVILGAFGGRPDHTLASLCVLEYLCGAGVNAKIVTDNGELLLLRENINYKFKKDPPFNYFSLIPVSEVLYEVTLKGFKYPLTDKTVSRSETLCVSNEITSDEGFVYIGKGSALAVLSYDS
jgi:thiamine pyrophosphokinase